MLAAQTENWLNVKIIKWFGTKSEGRIGNEVSGTGKSVWGIIYSGNKERKFEREMMDELINFQYKNVIVDLFNLNKNVKLNTWKDVLFIIHLNSVATPCYCPSSSSTLLLLLLMCRSRNRSNCGILLY